MMLQMSPLFWGNRDMVLDTSERIDKFREWDKLPADLVQSAKKMINAFTSATEETIKVVIIGFMLSEYR